ncbi:MAG: hypothetical protein FWF50_01050 [Defluviitaleaceae bacterium]|nr:hypothetical protein [Defluviitaleaceae bacterium]
MITDNINMNGRKKLENAVNDMYTNTISYNETMHERLKARIYKEISNVAGQLNSEKSFYIYTSAEEISKIDPIDEFLSPIIPEDLESANYNLAEINHNIKNGQPFTLATIFMECDFLTLSELIRNKKTYKGQIVTDKSTYDINFHIEHSAKYINEIEKLYRIFQNNGVKWRTINCPFAYKYIDLIIKEELATEGDIQEITINLDEYEPYKRPNVIPLWNVTKLTMPNSSNYMPVIDRLIFEHEIKLDSSINGYLLASHNNDYLYHRRQEDEFIMVTSKDIEEDMEILRVNNPSNFRKNSYAYEVLSNMSTAKPKPIIRTKSEIFDFVNSYRLASLSNLEILEIYNTFGSKTAAAESNYSAFKHTSIHEQTVNLNNFLDNNVRSDMHKKVMLLSFNGNYSDFLIYDKMSFLISELQLFFPEYRLVGKLV